MAGLARRNGWYSVRFIHPNGKRKTLALGTKSQERADRLSRRIGRLAAYRQTGESLDDELIRWIDRLPAGMRNKLIGVELLDDPDVGEATALGGFLDAYVSRRADVKQSTKINWSHTIRNLKAFFGEDCLLHDITRARAKDFLIFLKTAAASPPLSPDTIRKRICNAQAIHDGCV
ncbi:MAG: phage integrase SAM-like domain-containing protein [Pirellulaceae bacterium]|nr:phage integrase SAM-like domain-containing protein [Planctomycetales bacterium]